MLLQKEGTMPESGKRQLQMAERIRTSRLEAGLSQAQLAVTVGISRVAVAEVEAGRRKVSGLELDAIAKAVNQSTDYLLGVGTASATFGSTGTVAHLARAARQLDPEDQEQLLQ